MPFRSIPEHAFDLQDGKSDRGYLAAGAEALRPRVGVPPCVQAQIDSGRSPIAFVPSGGPAVGRQIGTRNSPKRTPAAR